MRLLLYGSTLNTSVYIDALNLYYGSLRGTPYKWLDIRMLCNHLLPGCRIQTIKYFTADVSEMPHDPEAPQRQQLYLRALRTLSEVKIIKGHFLVHTRAMHLADDPSQVVVVLRPEEKGSDVNLASHLLMDGYEGAYEQAVIVSDDSDLLEPVRIVRHRLRKPVGVLSTNRLARGDIRVNEQSPPRKRRRSKVLRKNATFWKPIREGVLAVSQFSPSLRDQHGYFHKPDCW